jgi:hypothetical protein
MSCSIEGRLICTLTQWVDRVQNPPATSTIHGCRLGTRTRSGRRIDKDHTSNSNRARAGLERAQLLELHIIESQLRLRSLLE